MWKAVHIIADYIHQQLCSVSFYFSRLVAEGPSLEETASDGRRMLETVLLQMSMPSRKLAHPHFPC